MEDVVSVVAQWTTRLTKGYQSFCIDKCLSLDTHHLPSDISTQNGKAWVTVSGNDLPALKNISVKYFGNWVRHPKYGTQFKAISYEIIPPKTKNGIISYLASPLFSGVGKRKAEKIYKAFGEETFKVIKNNPEQLERIVGKATTEKIVDTYNKTANYSELFGYFGKYGLSPNMVIKLIDFFGTRIKDVIKYTPYELQMCNIPFSICDRIALEEGFALDSYERVQGTICYKLREMETLTGNTYFEDTTLKKNAMKFLNGERKVISNEKYDELYLKIAKNHDGIVSRKFPNGNVYVMSKVYDVAEHASSEQLRKLLNNPVKDKYKDIIVKQLDKYCSTSSIKLSDKQKDAVKNSLCNRVSVITGGPGTGKTTIIKAIIAVYENVFKKEVTLMAPTGKAARRMAQATERNASTIHSRLGIYELNEGDRTSLQTIDDGLIIVDETSMVDMLVMQKLMSAVINRECHLIFVGDVDQLPSVGAGCVLKQMIDSGVIPTTKLTEIFRQSEDSSIVMNAVRINYGKTETIEFNDNDFLFVEANSEDEAKEKILEYYKKEVDQIGVDNVALLCPLRRTQEGKYICSSDGLNPLLQNIINPKDNYSNSYKAASGTEFRVNDRVMQWKNSKTSFNGDIGIIRNIEDDGDVMFTIEWDNGNTVEMSKDDMKTVELGYSMSIHKSQGSEYQTVIIPMLSSQKHCPLFKRNLIYTGVTRCKNKVIIVGDKETFFKAVKDNDCSLRHSFLANRLIKAQTRV